MTAASGQFDRGEVEGNTFNSMETAFQIYDCLYATGFPMKRFILFFSAALLVGRVTLCAEDAKPQGLPEQSAPVDSSKTAVPQDQPATPQQPPALEQPISLIPEALPNTPKKSGSDDTAPKTAGKKSKTTPKEDFSADAVKKRIRLREIKTQALKDEAIQLELETANAAKTDSDKRAALKRYYNLLCDRMLKIDSSLKTEIEARRHNYLARYDQNRVRTSEEASDFDLRNAQ